MSVAFPVSLTKKNTNIFWYSQRSALKTYPKNTVISVDFRVFEDSSGLRSCALAK